MIKNNTINEITDILELDFQSRKETIFYIYNNNRDKIRIHVEIFEDQFQILAFNEIQDKQVMGYNDNKEFLLTTDCRGLASQLIKLGFESKSLDIKESKLEDFYSDHTINEYITDKEETLKECIELQTLGNKIGEIVSFKN